MFEVLAETARGLVVLGKAADLIEAAARAHGASYPIRRASDMYEAVQIARSLASEGDAVVLSPACSSYDMFSDFGHRGRVFREAVAAVTGSGER